jgi:hypothetical protein
MITTIYVDMDGVLSNFKKRFIELFKTYPEVDYPSKKKEKEDYKRKFDDFITDGHFATLEPMPDFSDAISFLDSIQDDYSIKILSSTAQQKYLREVSKQKERWLTEWEIDYPTIFVPGKKIKQHYARATRLLIDDTLSNVSEWRERGGPAILHRSWEQTIAEFHELYLTDIQR